MELKQFEGERIEELSMIRVAKAVLEQKEEVMEFNEILLAVSEYIGLSEDEMNRRMPQFYTDMNVDGEFISLGENTWGLRTWYPVDSINEVLTHENDEADIIPHISADGFDDYDEVALEDEFKEEMDDEADVEDTDGDFDIEDDENLDEYQDNLDDLDTDDLDSDELEGLEVVDEDELLDEEEEEDDDDL